MKKFIEFAEISASMGNADEKPIGNEGSFLDAIAKVRLISHYYFLLYANSVEW